MSLYVAEGLLETGRGPYSTPDSLVYLPWPFRWGGVGLVCEEPSGEHKGDEPWLTAYAVVDP